ncbi:RNA exonuclease 5-like isoform X2 [Gigantopelta aegis]|nr:RNA exonuclease 5-like isoform X2 [Gigantopelta aegis]
MEKKSPESDSSSDNDDSIPVKQRKVVKEFNSVDISSVDNKKTSSKSSNWLSHDEAQRLRMELREKQKASMQKPKLYLTLEELLKQNTNSEEVDGSNDELPPLFMQDIQHLLLLGIMGNIASAKPRWCRLLRMGKVSSVVVMVINELCVSDLEEYADCLPFLKENFSMFVEVTSPHQYQSTADQDVFRVPLSRTQLSIMFNKKYKRKIKKSLDSKKKSDTQGNETIDRRSLLLNPSQLISEGYPLPIKTEQDRYKKFVFSKAVYTKPQSNSPMFAIDCEMCLTTARRNELARVSVVNEKLKLVYESYVKPYNKIINYLTRYSGMTKTILDPITVRLEDVQRDLQRLLPSDAIWCGQSLCSDLIALQMFHPYVIDTSVIYNLTGYRWKKTGLKRLTELFLDRKIQESKQGHSSVEDSQATMELVLLKLKNGLTFGDCVLEAFEDMQKQVDNTVTLPTNAGQLEDKSLKTTGEQKTSVKEEPVSCDGQLENKSPTESSGDSKADSQTSDSEDGDLESRDMENKHLDSRELENCSKRTVEERRNLFLQEKHYSSLFEQVKKVKKTAVVIDNEEVTSRWKSEQSDDVTCVEVSSDTACYKQAKKHVTDFPFFWTQFHGFSQSDSEAPDTEDLRKERLQKINKYLRKLMKKVKESSLVCVLLTGRDDQHKLCNGGAFVKIT